ncbi:glycosyltransferase family 39 protein [Candidatus Pelagibacter sp.]|nr:glycosyltransferase family 39 protein [Candidatus Pelagibacter sp.]|tara:strand:- start:1097 stop:2347 length:1251 start_codon:yes stop_codon:yes gene_type:complete
MFQINLDFDLIGFVSLFLVSGIFIFIAVSRPKISLILIVALIVRLTTLFVSENVFALPDSWGDAGVFEQKAIEWSKDGFLNVFGLYPVGNGFDSFFISWIIAFPYSIFGPSKLMGQSISLLFGMWSVFLGWKTANKLWNQKAANKAGWFFALFPTLVLYSCFMLREAYIYFFLLLAINGIINYFREKSLKSFILVFIGFIGATLFHEAMIVGLIIFLGIIGFQKIQNILIKFTKLKINLSNILFVIFICFAINQLILSRNAYLTNNKVGSLGNINEKLDLVIERAIGYHDGSARYPDWLVPDNRIEVIYKSPMRILYFLFAPFPWDIKKPIHYLGFLDSIIYAFVVYLIIRNINVIWTDPVLRIIFLVSLAYIIVFGIGVGNFGTGIRHRSKFIIMLVLLITPFLPKFTFKKKKTK